MPKLSLQHCMVGWDVPECLKTNVEEAVEVTFLILEAKPPVFVV